MPVETCSSIRQTALLRLNKKQLIALINANYPDEDFLYDMCVITTLKSGDFDSPIFSQSVTFSKVLEDQEVYQMSKERTTIMADSLLLKRVNEHLADKETLTDFYNRAILNQLEKEGDFEIRDLLEDQQKMEE